MCACGCLLILGLSAALVFCIMHALWLPAAGVVALACLVGWLGFKAMK
jgi:hypothetical protein